jgi:HSP20 family protein
MRDIFAPVDPYQSGRRKRQQNHRAGLSALKGGLMNLIPRSQTAKTFSDDFTNSFFSRMFDRLPTFANDDALLKSDWFPAVDIEEKPEAFMISVEVPGIDPKDIDVTAQDGMLTIKGERHLEEARKKNGMRTVERSYGRFVRSFSLPSNVASQKIKAVSKNGVLTVELPKVEPKKPDRIAIAAQ